MPIAYSHLRGVLPQNLAFVTHWESLRRAGDLPWFDDWVNALTPDLAAGNFRAEVGDNDVVVLFTGHKNVERRGGNNTGKSLFPAGADERDLGMRNMRLVLSHPCGLCNTNKYPGSDGDAIYAQTILLPLRLRAGKPQIIGHTADIGDRKPLASIVGQGSRLDGEWIDVGMGTPGEVPQNA